MNFGPILPAAVPMRHARHPQRGDCQKDGYKAFERY